MTARCAHGWTAGALAALVLGLTGCTDQGEGEPAADPGSAALRYAQCMRDNGVEFPDPDASGRIVLDGSTALDTGSRAYQDAAATCATEVPDFAADAERPDQAATDALLAFTRCMRENGVDLPDPGPDGSISAPLDPGRLPPIDQLEAAQAACRDLDPGLGAGSGTP